MEVHSIAIIIITTFMARNIFHRHQNTKLYELHFYNKQFYGRKLGRAQQNSNHSCSAPKRWKSLWTRTLQIFNGIGFNLFWKMHYESQYFCSVNNLTTHHTFTILTILTIFNKFVIATITIVLTRLIRFFFRAFLPFDFFRLSIPGEGKIPTRWFGEVCQRQSWI